MKHRKNVSGLVVLILVMLFLAGCGTKVTPPQPEPAPPVPEKIDVVVYYLKSSPTDFYLVREVHKLDKSSDLALTALNELIKGTPVSSGAYRVLPADTKVLGIKIDQGLATVDFSPEVLRANVGASGEALGITSIVNTLTELPNIQKVSFTVDGSVDKGLDWWGHVGLYEQPFSRDLSNVWEPAIWVTAPAVGQVVASPLKITGSARVFEATVSYRLKDANGNILATGFTTATEGAPGRGDFQGEMVFVPPSAGKGQLEVFWASPKDGSDQDVVVIPVEWK
ncbi:MAG: spore gernimation protein [Syntrophomonadaceae bacterium]|nr:spore gernimation protein [Syntrophomonadaceae bacterium]